MVTIARSLALALICLACTDVEKLDRRSAAASDSASRSPTDSLRDSLGAATPPPEVKPQPFDSSYEHYIRTVPEEELDSTPMPKTPG